MARTKPPDSSRDVSHLLPYDQSCSAESRRIMTAQITHLPADAPQEELLRCMAEDGAVIIDDVLGEERLEALGHDLAPFLNKEVYGPRRVHRFSHATHRRTHCAL